MSKVITTIQENYFSKREIVKRKIIDKTITIPRNELLRYLTTIRKNKSKKIRKLLPILRKKYPVIIEIEKIFHYFSNCLKDKTAKQIDKFVNYYIESKDIKIRNFAKGIKKDIASIKYAIENDINSGFVEGGNNKIKLIKRQCYGRIKFKD